MSTNDLERIDNLLLKVDAVRYSVPAILQSLSSSSRNADSHVLNYKAKINKANTSIDELEHGASALQGVGSSTREANSI